MTEDLDYYEKLKKDYDEENIKDTGLFYFDEKKKKRSSFPGATPNFGRSFLG